MLYSVWTSSKKLVETALYFNTVKSLLSRKGRWPNGCFSSYFLKWWHRNIFEESRTCGCSRQCSHYPQEHLWDLNQQSSWKPLRHLWRVYADRNREPTSSLTTHTRAQLKPHQLCRVIPVWEETPFNFLMSLQAIFKQGLSSYILQNTQEHNHFH